jgi:hypothetical protein
MSAWISEDFPGRRVFMVVSLFDEVLPSAQVLLMFSNLLTEGGIFLRLIPSAADAKLFIPASAITSTVPP